MNKFWLKFKQVPFEIVIFLVFLLTLPFQRRKILNIDEAIIEGNFLEWQSISVYLADIVLFILFILVCAKIINKALKNKNLSFIRNFIKKDWMIFSLISAFLFVFVVSSVVSYSLEVFYLYKFIFLAEGIFVFLFIFKYIKSLEIRILTLSFYIATCFFESLIGIGQFIKQQSIGLLEFGEQIISPEVINVAKIIIEGNKIIRSYGTFLHANSFGAYLALGIIFLLCLIVINIYQQYKNKNKKYYWVYYAIFLLCVIIYGELLSFSRSAWFGLFAGLLFIFIAIIFVFRKNFWSKKVKFLKNYIIPLLLVIIFCLVLGSSYWQEINPRFSLEDQSGDMAVSSRVFYNNTALDMIKKYPLFGVGPGNYVLRFDEFVNFDVKWWQYQPVHNIFLLVAAEKGIMGLVTFLLIIFVVIKKAIENIKKGNNENKIFKICMIAALISVLFIGFFDHHFIDLKQNFLGLWLVLGLLYGE